MNNRVSKELKRFNYIIGEIEALYHSAALKLGLSDSAMSILYTVYSEGNQCLLQDIVKLSGLSKQTINSAIRKLEKEKIIYLEEYDSKKKNVCFTKEGKQLAEKTVSHIIQIENGIFDSWSAVECENYLRLTKDYMLALKREVDNI